MGRSRSCRIPNLLHLRINVFAQTSTLDKVFPPSVSAFVRCCTSRAPDRLRIESSHEFFGGLSSRFLARFHVRPISLVMLVNFHKRRYYGTLLLYVHRPLLRAVLPQMPCNHLVLQEGALFEYDGWTTDHVSENFPKKKKKKKKKQQFHFLPVCKLTVSMPESQAIQGV